MKRTATRISGTATRLLPDVLALVVSILVFWLITANRSPNLLRPLSMLLRTGYTIVIPVLYVVLFLGFRLRGWAGYFTSLLLTLSIFALALAGAWATGQTESGLLSGVIPMFDSATYYADSLRMLAGLELSPSSSLRPLFITFFTFLLWATGYNLLHALALLTLLVSLACYLLARAINKTYGPAIATFVLVFVFVYYRYHSGVVRTENLGILFGTLGTALIWSGISRGRKSYLLAGLFVTSLGIIARAGAFLILPFLLLWGSSTVERTRLTISWRFLVGGMLAILAAFLANQFVMKSFGTKDVIPFGNFSYSLYGLAAGGKSWADVLELYPQADHLEIYRMAFRLILEQPGLFLKGVSHNFAMFFSNTNYGLFSYMGGEGELSATLSYWGLLLLSALGIWNWFHRREDPYSGFVLASSLGLLLSVPFLPPTDAFRLRVYATSIPIMGLLPSLGLCFLLKKLKLEILNPVETGALEGNALAGFSFFAVVMVLVGPFAARSADQLPLLEASACGPSLSSVVVRYEPSSAVHFVSQRTKLLDWAPTFHIGTLQRNVHDFPNFDFMDWAIANVGAQTTLFYALDYRSFEGVLARIDSASLAPSPTLLELCGRWEEDHDLARFDIFYAESAVPVP